jgi:hypothetical protein
MAGFPGFGRALNTDRKLGNNLRSNLYSTYLPGASDENATFSALLSQPFTKQPGGGVGDIATRNQFAMQGYNPTRSGLVTENEQQKNLFADALSATGSSRANIMDMIRQLLTMQTQLGTSSTAGLGGALGSVGQGFGL